MSNSNQQIIDQVVAQLSDIEVFAQKSFVNLKATVNSNLQQILQKAMSIFGTIPTENDFISILASYLEKKLGTVDISKISSNWLVKIAFVIIIKYEDSIFVPGLKFVLDKTFGEGWYQSLINTITNIKV